MVSRKRGQAAMEFLMTYGWAIMVVLIVIGALGYFTGGFNMDFLLPEKCSFGQQLDCKNFKVSDGAVDTILFEITNQAGRDMAIKWINVSSDAISTAATAATNSIVDYQKVCQVNNASAVVILGSGQTKIFVIDDGLSPAGTNCAFITGITGKKKFKTLVEYYWLDSSSLTHTFDGELFAKIEKT